MTHTYDYPRPMVTTDIIVFNTIIDLTSILLIKRLNEPFKNNWALPGGFVDKDEPLLDAANRELEEETGLKNLNLKQFYTFGNPNRDPRGHTISVVFLTHISNSKISARAGDDAKEVQWFNINSLPHLAFDHQEIILKAIKKSSANSF